MHGCAAEPRAYWIERLTAAGVPCGSVRDLHELFADPQIAARAMVAELEHPTIGAMRVLGTPLEAVGHAGVDPDAAAEAWRAHRRGADRRRRCRLLPTWTRLRAKGVI